MITKKQAEKLKHGTIIYDNKFANADKTPARWRVTGNVKTWKREPERFRVPIKHGLYDYGEITPSNAERFELSEAIARKKLRSMA